MADTPFLAFYAFAASVIGGAGYVVTAHGWSPWWMLAAFAAAAVLSPRITRG